MLLVRPGNELLTTAQWRPIKREHLSPRHGQRDPRRSEQSNWRDPKPQPQPQPQAQQQEQEQALPLHLHEELRRQPPQEHLSLLEHSQ